MSSPVFGREPSRPLPRDSDSDPTLEIDLTDGHESGPEDGSKPEGADAGRERNEHGADDESEAAGREVAADEPVAEGDQPAAEGRWERSEPEVDDESSADGDEPVADGGPGVEGAGERDGSPSGESDDLGESVADGDEPVADAGPGVDGAGERDGSPSGESDDLGESEQPDEADGLDVAELAELDGSPTTEPEASATRFDQEDLDEPEAQPVVLDAEDVSAEPALGHPEPVPPGPAAEPEPVPPGPAEEPEPVVPGPAAEPGAVPALLASPGGNGFEGPWVELQLLFVDDPQSATAGALQLLREALGGLSPEGASTEELRVAFRRYRAAYHDLATN